MGRREIFNFREIDSLVEREWEFERDNLDQLNLYHSFSSEFLAMRVFKEEKINRDREIKDFSQVFDNDSMLWAKFRRLATFMVYLSDVDAGGATVFPRLDLTVWPEKGKGVFWFNLDTNGSPDLQSLHGGCPVLKGSKWIANKWIKWQSHFDTSPCILKPYPEFKALKLW